MKFDTFQGNNGQWYWRCGPSTGGKKTADGSEGYASPSNAKRAARRLIQAIRTRVCRVDDVIVPHPTQRAGWRRVS